MREIKFRAWDKKNKKWLQADQISEYYAVYSFVDSKDKEWGFEMLGQDIELMQFTGLKDKNGKESFESDLVKREGEIGVIIWDKIEARFRIIIENSYPTRNYPLDSSLFEVIGNIYENPNLLK